MKKVIVFLIIVFLCFIGCVLYSGAEGNGDNNPSNNGEVIKDEYSTNSKVNVNNIYNYDKDEMEAGSLVINEGVLEFVDLENNVLNSYKYIDDEVKVIEKVYDKANERNVYIVLTKSGYLYLCDNEDFMSDEPFYVFEINYKVKDIAIKKNNNDSDLYIDAVNENDKKIEIKIN